MATSEDSSAITVFACTTALDRIRAIRPEKNVAVKRLTCAGGINAGMILEAVEGGAGRVLVLACDQASCRHQNGATLAEEQVRLARELLTTLGFNPEMVVLELVDRAGESVSVACEETAQ